MILALLAVAAVVFFVLDGFNVGGSRFNPLGFGLACAAIVVLWPVIRTLSA